MELKEELVELIEQLQFNPNCNDTLKLVLQVPDRVSAIADAIIEGRRRSDYIDLIPGNGDYGNFCHLIRGSEISGKTVARKIGYYGGLFLSSPILRTEQVVLPEEQEIKQVEAQQKAAEEEEYKKEKSYYALVQQWAVSVGGYEGCTTIGGQLPRYRWENPDLVWLGADVHKAHRLIELSCVSFEVKLNIDPFAVWQAAHYQRFSNEVYLAIAKSEQEIEDRYEGRPLELAIEFGLGILCFDKETKQFRMIHRPRTAKPSHYEVEKVFEDYKEISAPILERVRNKFSELYQFRLS